MIRIEYLDAAGNVIGPGAEAAEGDGVVLLAEQVGVWSAERVINATGRTITVGRFENGREVRIGEVSAGETRVFKR